MLESHAQPVAGSPAGNAIDRGSESAPDDKQTPSHGAGPACCGADEESSCKAAKRSACCEDSPVAASTCCSSDRKLQDVCSAEADLDSCKESSCCKDTTKSGTEAGKPDDCKVRAHDSIDALPDCSDECCDTAGEPDTILSSGACSSHLLTAFERFEALIRQSKCICRSVVEQLGFCCCALSSNGQVATDRACTGHTSSRVEKQKMKEPTGLEIAKAPCSGGCCAGPKEVGCDVSATAAGNDNCVDECCTESKQDKCKAPGQNPACGDASKACAKETKTSRDKNFKWQTAETPIDHGMNSDVEHGAAHEQVVLSVSGMTCTGCSTKMRNVLDAMPGLHKPKVTFVSGTAAFELDSNVAKLDELLPLIEHRTGFKCSRILEGHQHLDLQMTPQMAKQLEDSCQEGIVSITKTKQKSYRITYNPLIVGARDLVPPGTTLAPPTADPAIAKENKRLLQMTWYTTVAGALTIPVVVLNWAPNPVPAQTRGIISLTLASFVQAIAVPEFYSQAIKSLVFSKVIEMDMLVVISITAAYAYSIVAFALSQAGIELEQEAFFETSTLLITLVLFGRLIAAIARVRAIRAVSLRSLQVDMSLLLQPDGQTTQIDSRLLHFGDVVLVPAHSRIVTDGIVVSGASAVDESMLTGEAISVTKQHGDTVIAGTVNGESALQVRITRLPGANSISDIAKSVEDALGAKPRVQDLADAIASWFVPVVVAIAVVVFAIWIGIALGLRDENGGGAVGTAITYAIAVLAVSCPCALGLAVPMVLVIAGGVAARQGVVIKAADATERAFKATDVVFDKTGTLTKGDLRVVRLKVLSDKTTMSEALALAKALVKDDSHPVSRAIAAHLNEITLDTISVDQAKSIPGSGIQAVSGGRVVKAGNPFWLGMEDNSVVTELLDQGMTCFCIRIDDVPVLAVGLESTIRDEAKAVITALQNRHIKTHIVSGDHARAVEAVATSLGIELSNVASRHSPS